MELSVEELNEKVNQLADLILELQKEVIVLKAIAETNDGPLHSYKIRVGMQDIVDRLNSRKVQQS